MVSGFYFFDPKTGTFDPIVDPEADIADTRFNDGKTDRQGRFWSGTHVRGTRQAGEVHRRAVAPRPRPLRRTR